MLKNKKWQLDRNVNLEEVTFTKGNITINLLEVDTTDTLLRIHYRDKISTVLNLRKELTGFLNTMKILNNYKGSYLNEYKDIQYVTGIQSSSITMLIRDCLPLDIVRSKYTLVHNEEKDVTTYYATDKIYYKKQPLNSICMKTSGEVSITFSLDGVDLIITRSVDGLWNLDTVNFQGLPTMTKFKALENLLMIFTSRGKIWCSVSQDVFEKYQDIITPLLPKEEFKLINKIKHGKKLSALVL